MLRRLFTQILLWSFCWPIFAQNPSFNIPDAPNQARFVMDYVGVLGDSARVRLENRLIRLNDNSTAQMQIVLINDLEGADPIMYGTELGRKWGVGNKDMNNGVVIVVQPKTEENKKGEVGISVGYGLEGVLTDAFCQRIVDNELIPHFKNDDYSGGLDAALDVMIPVAQGESTAATYLSSSAKTKAQKTSGKADETSAWTGLLYVFLIIFGGVGFGFAVAGILKLLEKGVGSSSGRSYIRDDDENTRHYSSSSSSPSSSSGRSYGGGSFGGGGAKSSW